LGNLWQDASPDVAPSRATVKRSIPRDGGTGRYQGIRATSDVAGSRQLQAVTCVRPFSCLAVGNAVGAAGHEVTLVERYSGEDLTRRVWGHGFASRSPCG
jgi:hypothetical protein